MGIQRWDWDDLSMISDSEGDFVRHSHYEAEVARLRAELGEVNEHFSRYREGAIEHATLIVTENNSLRAELAAKSKDAERYAFIRDADRSDALIPYDSLLMFAGQSLDEEIDCAIGTHKAWVRFQKAMGEQA